MEIFNIEITKKVRQGENLFYVEFVPQNEYDDVVKKCDTIPSEEITDYLYLENVKTELYNLLVEMYGTEFTDKYEL
jgi:hypothetical protein